MANLKELRKRIASVKSTQKITSAMKMVAASRLRKSQDALYAAQPFADTMEQMLAILVADLEKDGFHEDTHGEPSLLMGSGKEDVHLLVVFTSDRGLCGGFNGTVIRETQKRIDELEEDGRKVLLLCVGRKGRDLLKGAHGDKIIESHEQIDKYDSFYVAATHVAVKIQEMFAAGYIDVCTLMYNSFISAITQEYIEETVVPLTLPEIEDEELSDEEEDRRRRIFGAEASYDYEPDREEILASLLPRNLLARIFRATLDSQASEHGARMTAMDNATRNAGDMIDSLSLTYNRTRQANITTELTEIISGAEAL